MELLQHLRVPLMQAFDIVEGALERGVDLRLLCIGCADTTEHGLNMIKMHLHCVPAHRAVVIDSLVRIDECARNDGGRCRQNQNDATDLGFGKRRGHGGNSVMGDAGMFALERFATFNAL